MKPEILAPAGNWAMLNAALNAGADAVYFGVEGMNMRHSARNFIIEDLEKIGKLKIKKYLALNTIVYDEEIEEVKNVIKKAKEAGIDAVICWDMAVLKMAKDVGMEVHLSTQASVSNVEAINFYKDSGVKRFILARELSLEQIKHIKDETNVEIECFVHGAMCVSVSGRCFMSHFLEHKSANRGRCFQPCRRPYIVKDKEMDYELEVGNNYIMSPKDLCTLLFIDKLIEAGIDSFKIEGRAKTPEYVDTVVRVYRKAVDAYSEGKLTEDFKKELMGELKKSYNRGFSSGFFLGKPIDEWATNEGNVAPVKKIEVGKVVNYYNEQNVAAILVQAEGFKVGDDLMVLGNKTGVVKQKVNSMQENNVDVEEVKKGKVVAVKFDSLVRENDRVYKII